MAADSSGPSRAARVNRLAAELRTAGLDELLSWLMQAAPGWPAAERVDRATAAFDHVWHASIVDSVVAGDAALAGFDGAAHSATVAAFREADRAHGVSTRQRVRRAVAERLTEIRTRERDQDLFLDKELTRKRGLKPLRDLVRRRRRSCWPPARAGRCHRCWCPSCCHRRDCSMW